VETLAALPADLAADKGFNMTKTRHRARAFTMIEALVVILLIVGIIVILPMLRLGRSYTDARQIKCSANVRGIHQGLVLFSQGNNDQYPLPSILDKANHTVRLADGTDPTAKDTTAAIISTLIYGNFFGPEICISPAEANGNIVHDNDYWYTEPKTVVNPKLAVWDPAFAADFTVTGTATTPARCWSPISACSTRRLRGRPRTSQASWPH
jgi:competence protein ComGC